MVVGDTCLYPATARLSPSEHGDPAERGAGLRLAAAHPSVNLAAEAQSSAVIGGDSSEGPQRRFSGQVNIAKTDEMLEAHSLKGGALRTGD
jgi:hypothetical protein